SPARRPAVRGPPGPRVLLSVLAVPPGVPAVSAVSAVGAGRTASGAGLARRLDLRPPLGLGLGLVGLGGLVRLAVLVLGALVLGVVALGEVDAVVVAVLVLLVVVVEVLGLFVLDDLHDGLLDEANLDAVGDLRSEER